jgi:hypothetical protein
MGDPDLEFLGPDGERASSDDEELADPGRWERRRPWLGRVIALFAAAGLVAIVVSRDSDEHNSQATVQPSPASITRNQPPTDTGTIAENTPTPESSLPVRHGADPARCPGLRCQGTSSVPAATLAALQQAFPGANVVQQQSVRLIGHRRPLWYRSLTARLNLVMIYVIVEATTPSQRKPGLIPRFPMSSTPTKALRELTVAGDLVVAVSVSGATDQKTQAALDSLFQDPRLLAR